MHFRQSRVEPARGCRNVEQRRPVRCGRKEVLRRDAIEPLLNPRQRVVGDRRARYRSPPETATASFQDARRRDRCRRTECRRATGRRWRPPAPVRLCRTHAERSADRPARDGSNRPSGARPAGAARACVSHQLAPPAPASLVTQHVRCCVCAATCRIERRRSRNSSASSRRARSAGPRSISARIGEARRSCARPRDREGRRARP